MKRSIFIDPGTRFGMLTVIEEKETKPRELRRFLCKCDCGNETVVDLWSLRRGSTKSCGCLRHNDNVKERRIKHGGSVGEKKDRLYAIWLGMKSRCYRPKTVHFEYYGGKGIKVCDEWVHDFPAFRKWALDNGYADDLTIDRIDSDKDYCPENCRWATKIMQANNVKTNLNITYKGETHSVAEWGRITGIPDYRIRQRYRRGFQLEEVFFYGNLRKRQNEKTNRN